MPVNETTLESFLGGNISILDELIGTEASQLTSLLSAGAISGMEASEILNQVTVAASPAAQRALINTRLNTYSRVATNTMMKDAPKDTKYVYVGPVDDRTRDECLDMASQGALTEEQIISKNGAAVLADGGGFNCRHKWEIASDEGIKLFEGKQAQQVIAGKTKDLNVLSPKMAGKHTKLSDAKQWTEKHIAKKVRFDKDDIGIDDYNNMNKLVNETVKKYDLPLLDEIGWQTEIYKKTKNVAFLVRSRDGIHKMAFNKSAIKRWKERSAELSMVYKLTGRKWAVDHLSLDSVIRHEIGHHLYYSTKGLPSQWNLELQLLRKKTGFKGYFELSKKVSEYASSNPSELFAEVHSAVMMGLSNNVPSEILSIYNKVLGQ